MTGFTLNEEQLALQKKAREFADTHMKPYASEIDRAQSPHFDRRLVERFAAAGFTQLCIPEEYGGFGAGSLTVAITCEELAAACAGMSTILAGSMLAINCLRSGGTPEQRSKYLPLLADKKGKLGALAITETGAGSDMGSIATIAKPTEGGYILSGSKYYITNAGIADLYIVLATTEPAKKYAGLDLFIVPAGTPGLSTGRIEDKLGLRASQTGELIFDGVRVPSSALVGRPGTGFLATMQALDLSRPAAAVCSIGIARAAYETALDYTKKRVQFGRPLFRNQAVAFALVDMVVSIDAARLLTWRACHLIDSGEEFTAEASMAKLFASETAERVTSQAMHLVGAAGYSRDLPLEKYYRDAKAMTVLEGASEIQRHIIAGEL
jgi:alkylation response protein AidB-like acyl-CoA dehydrogenase